MISLNDTLVLYVFIITTILGLSAKIYKWVKRKQHSDEALTKLQIKYFICYFSFMAGFIFQGPYVHQRYHETGMTSDQINNIMSCFNIVSAIWGFLVGYVCELLGHKMLIILSAILLGLHAVCRSIGGYQLFCIASILMGLSTASNRVVFEDFLADQIQEIGNPKGAQSIVKENTALFNLILTIVMTPLSAKITSYYGAKSAFVGASILWFTSALIIFILMPRFSKKIEGKKLGLFGAFKGIIASFSSFEYALFVIMDFLYQFYGLMYNPRWTSFHKVEPKEKIPLSQISSTCSMSLVNGAQVCTFILMFFSEQTSLTLSFLSYFLSVGSMYLFYENKNILFLSYVMASTSDGSCNSLMWTLRSQIYPSEIRKHLMGIIRFPASLATTAVLQFMKGKGDASVLGLCVRVLSVLSLLALILVIYRRKRSLAKNA